MTPEERAGWVLVMAGHHLRDILPDLASTIRDAENDALERAATCKSVQAFDTDFHDVRDGIRALKHKEPA